MKLTIKKIALLLMFIGFNITFAQVGINTKTPKSTLDIFNENETSPTANTGVIIPRVSSLNLTDNKEIGLLVFLDSSDTTQKGFYWWDGSKWNPFISTNRIISKKYITYASTSSYFKEGDLIGNTSNARTLDFDYIKSLDPENFEISNGELVVKKAGYYYLKSVAYLKKNGGDYVRRDQLDLRIYINGGNASAADSFNFDIQGSNGFAVQFLPITIIAAGTVKLKANDRLSMRVVRSYSDPTTNSTIINADVSTKSNLILSYLGSVEDIENQ